MAKTVVGSFNSYAEAQQVVEALVGEGVRRDDISVVASNASGEVDGMTVGTGTTAGHAGSGAGKGALAGGAIGGTAGLIAGLAGLAIPGIGPIIAAGPIAAALAGAGVGAMAGGLIGGLTQVGVSEEDAGFYAESVRRGGALVTVRAEDAMADRVAEIMNRHEAVDIDQRAATWRQTGWSKFDAQAQPLSADDIRRERETVLPVVEEKLSIGKREVDRGGVRVYTHMTERPVEETVTLREEHAHVERRPVDRPATEADLATFREGEISIRERAEEPVIAKQARVVEEVVVGKETTQRQQTIRDTVRHTEVEVDQIAGNARASGDDAYFREHYAANYQRSGGTYDEYAPAYQYGGALFGDQRYRGRDWAAVEPDARRAWERANPGRGWDRFKGAVQRGWERASNAVERAIPGDADRDGR